MQAGGLATCDDRLWHLGELQLGGPRVSPTGLLCGRHGPRFSNAHGSAHVSLAPPRIAASAKALEKRRILPKLCYVVHRVLSCAADAGRRVRRESFARRAPLDQIRCENVSARAPSVHLAPQLSASFATPHLPAVFAGRSMSGAVGRRPSRCVARVCMQPGRQQDGLGWDCNGLAHV